MSRFSFPDGQIVRIGQEFFRDDTRYPADWLAKMSPAERDAEGLVEILEPAAVDARYYTTVETSPGQYEQTPVSIEQARAVKWAELANLRYEKETGGATLPNSMPVRTDRESQALLTGAAVAASLDPEYEVDWKTPAGFVTLDATQLLAVAQAVRGHVQACFSNERAHAEAIAALTTIEAVAAYDLSSGWPG
jgi:hypothetical protein